MSERSLTLFPHANFSEGRNDYNPAKRGWGWGWKETGRKRINVARRPLGTVPKSHSYFLHPSPLPLLLSILLFLLMFFCAASQDGEGWTIC
ncbi:hypothetical protein CEXT_388681 [Caerostris extrusa]|uniref:Uncharacterized protein n=1 Tax=Caerostris extrusa TaxID=172846 RepID=A0AAV4TB42_CAEEX|nr:hypothetical protein CEXT_388681 [Caerostris extrusa]